MFGLAGVQSYLVLFDVNGRKCLCAQHLASHCTEKLLPEIFYGEFSKALQQVLYCAAMLQQLIEQMRDEHGLIIILQRIERIPAV